MTKVKKIIRSDKPIYDHPSFYDPNILFSSTHKGIEYIEEWKDIIGYEDCYAISSFGRVFSKVREQKMYHGGFRSIGGKLLKQNEHRDGYVKSALTKNSKTIHPMNHRLVAICFIENIENKPQVNHKKGIKKDNRFFMLEWNTAKENTIHSVKNKLRTASLGEKHHRTKLSNSDVLIIKRRLNEGESRKSIAKEYGTSTTAIHGIHSERTWGHIKMDGFRPLDSKGIGSEKRKRAKKIKSLLHKGLHPTVVSKICKVNNRTVQDIHRGIIHKNILIDGFKYRKERQKPI